jgi:hypothetical protein
MKINRIILCVLVVICTSSVFSQSIEDVKANRGIYLWGEGSAPTLDKARKTALDMLVNQISVQVESNYQQTITQENKANSTGGSFSEKVNSIVKTYSNATLTNVEQIIVSEEPDAKVFLYVKRSEISKIFASRKQKIIDNISLAYNFEQKLQIADALRLYYWSLILLKSHPDCQSMMYNLPGETKEISLISWLPAHINDVFGNIFFRVKDSKRDNDQKTVLLDISYKGQPVSNLDFCFWDGRNYSQVQGTTNGQSSIELLGASALLDNVKIKAEYTFDYQARIDKELESIMEKIDPIAFSKSYYTVNTDVSQSAESNLLLKTNAVLTAEGQKTVTTNSTQSLESVEIASNQSVKSSDQNIDNTSPVGSIPGKINEQCYQSRIDRVVEAIHTRNYASLQSMFTPGTFQDFNSLVKTGNAKVMGTPHIDAFNFEGDVMCRAVPMMFSFSNNNRKFSEEVVFHFNQDTIINNITFGLNKAALNSITSNPKYAVRDQLIIINFLENYKTAFALKRIDYLESIFADDALIIVGQYVRTALNVESPYANNKIVRYNRMDKQTYIRNLKQAFQSQEFINIGFEDSQIEKSAKGGNVYGIEIKQNYYSSSYGDQGYLFLMVDLNADPIIHIRAWQPEKGINGRTFKIGDF